MSREVILVFELSQAFFFVLSLVLGILIGQYLGHLVARHKALEDPKLKAALWVLTLLLVAAVALSLQIAGISLLKIAVAGFTTFLVGFTNSATASRR